MTKSLLAAVVAASLASGCTILAPVIANGVQSTPAQGDIKAQQDHAAVTTGAFIAGVLVDAVLISVALDFQNTLEHSGD